MTSRLKPNSWSKIPALTSCPVSCSQTGLETADIRARILQGPDQRAETRASWVRWHTGAAGLAVVLAAAIVQDQPVDPRLAALLVLASLAACVRTGPAAKAPARQGSCADFEVEVETHWSASVKARVMNKGGEITLERRSGVVNKMDRISEDWVMLRTSVCKDYFVRELISATQYAARVRCLDDRLERQRSLATTMTGQGGDWATIEHALDELIATPPSCDSPEQ